MLIDNPGEILKADSCMLPLTSSGNVLFWIAIIYNKLLKIVSLKITEIFKSLMKITFYNHITNPRGQSRKSTVLFYAFEKGISPRSKGKLANWKLFIQNEME